MATAAEIATLRRSLTLNAPGAGGPADADVGAVLDEAATLLDPYVDHDDDTGDLIEPTLFGEAVQIVAADIWHARVGPAGATITGSDFTPSPYRMGRSLVTRVRGILATSWNVDGMVG